MAEVDTSFYRPQPQQNPLDLISKIGGAANSLGDLAVGQGMQQALDPATGQIDQNKLLTLLKQSPVGAMKAVPTLDALAKLRQAGYAADQAGIETFQKRMALTSYLFSRMPQNPTMDDVYDVAAHALDPKLGSKEHGITLPVVMNTIKEFQNLPKGPDGKVSSAAIKRLALEKLSQANNTQVQLEAHAPRGEWKDQGSQMTFVPTGTMLDPALGTAVPKSPPPTQPKVLPGGAQTIVGEQPAVPGGRAVGPSGRPVVPAPRGAIPAAPGSTGGTGQTPVPGATPGVEDRAPFADRFAPPPAPAPMTALPPGESKLYEASADRAAKLQSTAQNTAQYHADLNNLKTDSNILENISGPTAEVEKKLNQLSQRLAKVGVTMTPEELKAAESFDKIVHQITLQQGQIFGGTDAARSISIDANPNLSMSKIGRAGVIDMLQGNQDAVDVARQQWLKARAAGVTASQHDEFMNELVTPSDPKKGALDPRVFQFNRMSRDNQQKYLDQMDHDDLPEFEKNYRYAIAQKWVKPPKAK